MTDPSPWSDDAKPAAQNGSKKTASVLMSIVLLALGFGFGVLMTWIVNWATLADMERTRARASADLKVIADKELEAKDQIQAQAKAQIADMAGKLAAAEIISKGAQKVIDEAQAKATSSTRQADEASRQLGDARKDAASVRGERDEARGLTTLIRAEIDKMKVLDANPAALPVADLSKAMNGIKLVRCTTTISLKAPLLGVTETDIKNKLSQSLTNIGLTCSDQSPVEIMLLVSFSDDQPRRALGVMLLVTRVIKVPGEALSKQAAVWG